MRCASVLMAVLLTACGQQPAENLADALAADPVRLKALRQCAADRQAVGEDACRAAAEAFRRRFLPPGRMNTTRWLNSRRFRRASIRPQMNCQRAPFRHSAEDSP